MSKSSARKTALDVYSRVINDGAYSNLVLNNTLSKSKLSQEDKALVTKIVYGTLQWQGLIDYHLSTLSKRPLTKLSNKALYLLRIGAYQILFLDRVPDRACVDETVQVAKKISHKGIVSLINGVLRNLSRQKESLDFSSLKSDPAKYLSVMYSHPQWLVEMWWEQFGYDKTVSIMEANNKEPENTIRTNTLLTDRFELQKQLSELGFSAELSKKVPEALILKSGSKLMDQELYKSGHFQFQDLNSMVVSHFCSPNSNDVVMDLCSSPGSKTTHMAQLMSNGGKITAVDIHEHRINLVKQACDRLKVNNVSFVTEDGTKLPWDSREQQVKNKYDLCLVDAPCSGLGTLRKRPELKWTITSKDIEQLVDLQAELLHSASNMVKSGGAIVYSTCTVNQLENQDQIERFLSDHSKFSLKSPEEVLNSEMLADASLTNGMANYFPGTSSGDGFFMAKILKN